jgi:polyphosphate kinase
METSLPFIDRDLSWLSFNERVLLEAEKPYTPVIEKLRFLAIYSSNLDEFYRVRVAAFQRAVSDAKGKSEDIEEVKLLLIKIQKTVDTQQRKFGKIYRETVLPELEAQGIKIWRDNQLDLDQTAFLLRYFQTKVRGLIHFQEEPVFLENRMLYLAVSIEDKAGEQRLIYVNIPTESNRFIAYPSSDEKTFIFLDDLIRIHLPVLFPDHQVLSSYSIKMNRDAELYLEDEYRGDLKKKILKSLSKRSGGAPSRLLVDEQMPQELREKVGQSLGLETDRFIEGARYHNFSDFFGFKNPFGSELEYPRLKEIRIEAFEKATSLLDLIEKGDQLLHFPYQPYDYVLRLFNEAATDHSVTEIRATMYRMSSSSAIAKAFISAAKNGKKVVVFIELKARFDEANNIEWSEKMKAAGVKIIYSIPDIKVHAKVALFTRQKKGRATQIAFYGTGNFNEKTAAIYTDHALLTANPVLNKELDQLLKHLEDGKVKANPSNLLIAGFNMVKRFSQLVDREIAFARRGVKAEITIKLNNLEDKSMIRKLYEAAANGVKVNLITRGICCLRPDANEHIEVTRVVGRFLEHGRVFYFKNGGKDKLFMGSADWMKRNLHSRIEVVFPILDKALQEEMMKLLDIQQSAHRGTAFLDGDLTNQFPFEEVSKVTAQEEFYQFLATKEASDQAVKI